MNDNNHAAATRVIAVLLADGWHQIVPSSFTTGPLDLGGDTSLGVPGFRFEEADAGSPHRPTVLAGPLHSILAIRQAAPAMGRLGDLDRARAAHHAQRAGPSARRPARASR